MEPNNKKQFRFQGHLKIGEGKQAQFVCIIEYQLHDPTSLNIDLHLLGTEEEQRPAYIYLNGLPFNHLFLFSNERLEDSVEVLGIHRLSIAGPHVTISAAAVLIGINKKSLEDDSKWYFQAELVPSGILIKPGIREHSYTGNISFRPLKEGKIEISTSLGIVEAGERYDNYRSDEYGNEVTHVIQRASITGGILIPKGSDLFSVNESLQQEADDICATLSLCYRQPVSYYEIEYYTDPETTPNDKRRSVYFRRKRSAQEKKIDQEELIHHDNLTDGGLDILVRSFKNSKHKEELSRAIRFLASSYKMVTLESSYFLAYSALDLVTSAWKSANVFLLGSAKWKKVEKSLRSHLDSIAVTEGITEILSQMKDKLPELRRASGDRRIGGCQKFCVSESG